LVIVDVNVRVGLGVRVGDRVEVGRGVRVGLDVAVKIGVRVEVKEGVTVAVDVDVNVGAAVAVLVRVGVRDNSAVANCACKVPAALVASALRFSVGEGTGVRVAVCEAVGDGVLVSVALAV
jgi:hypothetical protein